MVRKFVIPFLIFLGVLSHYIISDPTKGFTLLVLIYIITIPISPLFYYRLRSNISKPVIGKRAKNAAAGVGIPLK